MNKSKKIVRAIAVTVGAVLSFGSLSAVAACKPKENSSNDKLVIMTEPLNGLFNPFYSTAGTDMTIVGMTQVSMLSTNEEGNIAYGENEPTVVLDYKKEYDENAGKEGETTYYFVLKNGIKFSDGTPLTMNDVLFNMYVYLDPVYTGSSTMYSTDIVGLSYYRTQTNMSGDNDDDPVLTQATARAEDRINELINLYKDKSYEESKGTSQANLSEAAMRDAISNYTSFSDGYKNAIYTSDKNPTTEELQKQLLADYEFTLKTFKEELTNDYSSAKDSFTEEPYKSTGEFDEVTSFMYMEGFVDIEYEQTEGQVADKSKIKKVTRNYNTDTVKDEDSAINYVYVNKVTSALNQILTYWGTANTVRSDFISKATEVILHENLQGGLNRDYIEGISSLGHESATKGTTLKVGDKDYKIASSHNEDGTVTDPDTYDVLRIRINGIDPKAVWNFGFSVAPYHYYSDPDKYEMNIENHKFGVEWGSYEFMTKVIQGTNKYGVSKNKVPLGAGAYAATNRDYQDNPKANEFENANVVWFKANDNFFLGEPKIKHVCYQVVSSSNALDMLKSGSVHFVTPQFTKANQETLQELKSKGFESSATWQLGYGYIGINAGKVEDINLRKAIMAAMNTKLALSYYSPGTSVNIAWPMSVVGWAYPRTATGYDASNVIANMDSNNEHSYTQFTSNSDAVTKVKEYMSAAGVSAGDSRLKMKFTIAGANLTEHPTYAVFKNAAEILNSCGWDVEVVPDNNALIKLSTGALTVWAAAWGSTIDPDMYQVYHKNSTATSTLAWGYREILANKGTRAEENNILSELAVLIDAARETDVQSTRSGLYKQAMGKVLDLAVEMPVYQRQELYAYNANVIDENSFPKTVNSYSSPLARIWELEFTK